MKRFTETNKWRDPWFRRLSPAAKLLWLYATDNCSCIGVVEIDWDALKFDVGCPILEKHLDELGDRLQVIGGGKYFIPKFIRFQYGEISESCPAHKPIFKAVIQHQLVRVALDYQYPNARVSNTLQDRIGKGKEEGVQGESRSTIRNSTVIPEPLNVPEFRAAWVMWLEHLKQKRKPPSLHAQDLQLRKLADMGAEKATATIHHCIEHNWQSIYEQNNGTTHFKHNPRNDGIADGPTDYGQAAKRKLERQALEDQKRYGQPELGEAGT